MYIDSHCHLSFPELQSQLPAILHDMALAQVSEALVISTTMEGFPDVLSLAHAHERLWASAGVHPDSEAGVEPSVDDLLVCAQDPRVVAIGETGLDYYRLNGRSRADMAWQRERFAVHIEASLRANLPLVVHTRQASDDTLSMIKACGGGRATGVFHCFTETMDVARAALDLGFYISFSGILTFKSAESLRQVAQMVPLDRCLIETDSPYLAPVPYRGKTNTPAWVPWVAKEVARLKALPVEAVAQATTANFRRLFARTLSGQGSHEPA